MRKLVEFHKTKGGSLRITFTRAGRREAMAGEIRDDSELFEWQIANGWDHVAPEEVGALTDATILSDECERDEHATVTKCGRVYSDINYYQLESTVDRLLRLGEVIWRGVAPEPGEGGRP